MVNINEALITTDPIPCISNKNITLSLLRLDKIHAIVSGNKWYKLRFYLQDALQKSCDTIVTFGGAYSNHIIATAAACKLYGLKSIGIIRGEAPQNYSHTLLEAAASGMQLIFLDRTAYQQKTIPAYLQKQHYYFVPEGGHGALGAQGAATIPVDSSAFDEICCAVGTGTMMAGLIQTNVKKVTGISVMKNNFSLHKAVADLSHKEEAAFHIVHDYHFGGYAKKTPELIDFMNDLYTKSGIPTDFVYTAKLLYGVQDLIAKNYFPEGSKILAIHSGGLQGNDSLPNGTLIF